MIPIRVHHLSSPLGAGILRAALYEDGNAWDTCADLYGPGMLNWSHTELPRLFSPSSKAPMLLDCRCPDWVDYSRLSDSLVICLCDNHIREQLPKRTISRSGDPCFPAFPHRWSDMLRRSWEPAIRPWQERPSIGFCGVASRPEIRARAVATIQRAEKLEPRVIERGKFLGMDVPRQRARQEYRETLQDCDYQLCVRGVGNWDYRVYETLMAGRVPVLVDTGRAMPCEAAWDRHVVVVPEKWVGRLESYVLRWHEANRERWEEVQAENRTLWLEKLSPVGWWAEFGRQARGRLLYG